MSHTTPDSHNVVLDFDSEVNTPTNPHNVVLDFGASSSATQYVSVGGINSSVYGQVAVKGSRALFPTGFIATSFGEQELIPSLLIKVTGYSATSYGAAHIWNFNREIEVFGFDESSVETPSKVYNLRQYIQDVGGDDAASYGAAYIQGGVKYLDLNNLGFDAAQYGLAIVINTKADLFVNLVDEGITPQEMPSPDVSPRILYPTGILAWQFGNALVKRNPSPKGFTTDLYGTAWVSHSPRYLLPAKIDAFNSGYPKVFDPTQKIYVTGVYTVIVGGVFGDISAKNTRRIITVSGLYSQSFSDWSIVGSNLRNIIHSGFDAQRFGSNAIQNKTPSIAPIGIYSFDGLNSGIGYRIRTLKPSGWYQPKFGTHTLTKPPELNPVGIYQNDFGTTWISNKTRSIYAGLGHESLAIGEINVWHFARYLNPTGIVNDEYGTPRVEHGRRVLLANGSSHSVYGDGAWVSYAVRQLSPSSITYPNIPIHRVGGPQHIQPFGYVATLFGSRIIPIRQFIYPQGFINPFGLAVVDLRRKYLKPNGFLSTGQEGGHRFGTAKFWNKRQYIVQFYDLDSGLVPPKWIGWTSIVNRNRIVGAIGSNFARVAEPYIENKARPLLPLGIDAQSFGKPMIADRVRYLKLQGLESPYISGWSAIYNAAPVIAQKGFKTDAFGMAAILNTRRYFSRIGNFESLEMGKPMIADRIRTLKFEQRYTISPPIIPLPIVDLYTRYIEEVGRFDEHQVFGLPILNIRWNKVITRWTHRDYFGDPILKNLTPELKQRGHNGEEFGQTNIRTQWRELLQQGSENILWGKSEIAFRDRQFSVSGFTQWAIPTHKVTKTGVPPYYPQYIWLDAVEIDGEQNDGHGISIPGGQVPRPLIKTNVIFVSGFNAARYGEDHHAQSNGIVMEYGISMPDFDQMPHVTLKNRTISINKGIDFTITVGKPRLSPHTIYAVMEAPLQAIANHYSGSNHYVNSGGGTRWPGEVFGQTLVSLKHRLLQNIGLGNRAGYGVPQLDLKRRYIEVKGMQAHRMGWHNFGDETRFITQSVSSMMSLFGDPTLKRSEELNRTIHPHGADTLGISSLNYISHFHRTMRPNGFNSERMGTQLGGDEPFMWQGLRVGKLVKGNYGGFENEAFGQAWISNKIREVGVQGYDAFKCEYDYTNFDERMRVIRKDLPKPSLSIQPVGVDALVVTVPNIKPAVHYIRPDGNADQYRKGAF
ncbi:hypothetical protein [Acinetobacter towneri]|uniref:Uncharacterized protein n=1 Tax=Acinetobacter towneri TaxID=202956 RepID=A0A1E8E4T5_9GAMM|nr:hypothetical protein [Acinetobacter towneri]OFE44635.1 hypothetical protein BJN41_00460 [Acinetobacter towneri]